MKVFNVLKLVWREKLSQPPNFYCKSFFRPEHSPKTFRSPLRKCEKNLIALKIQTVANAVVTTVLICFLLMVHSSILWSYYKALIVNIKFYISVMEEWAIDDAVHHPGWDQKRQRNRKLIYPWQKICIKADQEKSWGK